MKSKIIFDAAREKRWRDFFGSALCNNQEIDVWVNPETEGLIFRGLNIKNRPKKVDQDARYVGRYRYPYPITRFVCDVHAALA